MDLTGSYTTTSINGNKYKLSLIDSHTNLAFEYYMKDKSAASVQSKLQEFIDSVIIPRRVIDKDLGYIYIFRDCGTEFNNQVIKDLLLKCDIIQTVTVLIFLRHMAKVNGFGGLLLKCPEPCYLN